MSFSDISCQDVDICLCKCLSAPSVYSSTVLYFTTSSFYGT